MVYETVHFKIIAFGAGLIRLHHNIMCGGLSYCNRTGKRKMAIIYRNK